MGDHFILCVDRLITASTLESATAEAQRPSQHGHVPLQQNRVLALDSSSEDCKEVSSLDAESSEMIPDSHTCDYGDGPCNLVECRICQDEDDERNMESPCACSGSLKYAHRKCVQRWCNEKGDITCEICHQQYKPDYTAPQPAYPDDIPIDIRSSWEISEAELDLRDPRLLAMVAAERHFFESEYGEYSSVNSSGTSCLRSAALILMALLLLRHALAITNSGGDEDGSTFFTLFLLRAAGFILPCYVMARAMSVIHRRRQRQTAIAAAEVALRLQQEQARLVNRQHLINVQ
ncbi:hypothetical protein SUGI_0106220 [Cryptomeria japonica]|uniref:uncharacterized protein LOC131046200 isoform X2 n=1 Tax=Cryptomeria japonica TaxID=3369 RepID=UPI002408B8F1|nr:uncharacterized protein LOC131046200 isoform X2 [Cryptomeria japonica]GLJ09310.1 hypothetical protein SUGI_0106220 [Cryptomeria japonica]